MKRMKFNVLGISEVKWKGIGSINLLGGDCFIYPGGVKHEHGVGVMVDGSIEKSNRLLCRVRGSTYG